MSNTKTDRQSLNRGDRGQLVVFGLGKEEFGVDIHSVREIVRLPEVTPVPRSPEYATGICNLRGSVLPVIDTRCRFGMDTVEPTDQTRMLVIESAGTATGIIVDRMKEVLRLHDSVIENTPGVCRGVDEEFLSGVVSLDKGKRLIMALNLEQVIDIEISEDYEGSIITESTAESRLAEEIVKEEQLVSFQVGPEEYGIDIKAVKEILRVTEITEVPNVPDFVKGLFFVRNRLIPVVDLRRLLGMEGMAAQYIENIDAMKADHEKWVWELESAIKTGGTFVGETDPGRCKLGSWITSFRTASQEIQNIIKEIRGPHALLHRLAKSLLKLAKTSKDEALAGFKGKIRPLLEKDLYLLDNLKNAIKDNIHEDQRFLVVDDGVFTVGYLVDHVNEVMRIPESIINETPSIAKTVKNEIRGVAKMDEGKRLILIMEEGAILSGRDNEALAEIATNHATAAKAAKSVEEEGMAAGEAERKKFAEQNLEEEQVVTFFLDKEEYGLRIMEVKEINRLDGITDIPRAPSFIDGVTNLRGNVVPVLNLRTLFSMEARESDDASRIIIVEIEGCQIGMLVDKVNEVMRLSKSNIDKTPAIIKGDNQFMDGICRLNQGNRMISILNIEHLLDSNELADFSAMDPQAAKPSPPKKSRPKMKAERKIEPEPKLEPKSKPKSNSEPEKGGKKKMKIAE
jgi:chemotaxis signal transduction protein